MTLSFARRWGWGALKFFLVVLGIVLLLHQLNQHRTFPLSTLWNFKLLAGWLLSVFAFAAFAARFRASLRIVGQHLAYWDSLRINSLGAFLDFIIPVSGGGDAAKYLRIRTKNYDPAPWAPAAGIALDHCIGFVAALLLFLVLIGRLSVALDMWGKLRWVILLTAIFAITGWILGRVYRSRITPWISRMRAHRVTTLVAVAWSILMQTLLAGAVYLAAASTAIAIDYLSILWVLAASALSSVIPVKVGGLGARDVVGAGLFVLLGLPTVEAVLLATILYGYRATIAVAGGLVELATSRMRKTG